MNYLAEVLRSADVPPSKKVQAACMLRGESVRGMARRMGRSYQVMYKVLSGREESHPLKQAVADDLNVQVLDIWGRSHGQD